MRGDWKDEAMQYRDVDRAAQKRAEEEIERQRYAEKMRPKWKRAPELDRRIRRGDDFAGDAWRDEFGHVRYTAVGHKPR